MVIGQTQIAVAATAPSPQPQRILAAAGAATRGEGVNPFSIPVRVYYEDTDVGAVVYYANYLRFIERARSDWLRAAGFELDVIQREQNAVFVVRRVEADYFLPATLGNLLTVTAEPTEVGASRMVIRQRVTRQGASGEELLFAATVTVAFIAADLSGPLRMPKSMRDTLKAMMPNTSAQAPE